mmetsp:Transcript_21297/g.35212  ORF Transcript_21297/g.35212 Transcript_21297/m.35212 type:complete len:1036 (+) Transcript_21297:55-3162(+)
MTAMTLRVLVLGVAGAIYVAGEDCQAVSCQNELSGEDEEALLLLQRRARSFAANSSAVDATVGGAPRLHHVASLATRALELGMAQMGISDLLADSWRRAAAWTIGLWVTGFCISLSLMMHSVLAASPSPKDDGMGSALRTERQDVKVYEDKKKAGDETDDILTSALSVNIFRCLSFTWLDAFLANPDRSFPSGRSCNAQTPRLSAANLWSMLWRVGTPRLLICCAWLVAFLELVAMVLILDGLLLMYEHRNGHWNGPHGPLPVTLAVLFLLFLVPLLYRYFSALLLMMDGLQMATVTNELTSMLFQKALRLPLGASYHGHGTEELTGWQVATALVESIVQEGPLMLRSLALLTAAPCMVCVLLLLQVLHLRYFGLLGLIFLLPGALIAGLLVKCAIASRMDYQRWHQERLRCQSASKEMREQIMNARRSELVANQWYSVMMAMLAGTLQAVVWLVVVASLYLATRETQVSARNLWLMLQMVTSLQACVSLIFSALRRAWHLPGALQRVECFLAQPEMPQEVVRRPLCHSPTAARISGSFSFEEGGPSVLDLELSLQRGECVAVMGAPGCGKSALLLALLGELFPCGLSCVSSTAQRCFAKGADARLLDEMLSDVELLLWDCGKATSPLADLCASSRARGVALLVALDADVGDAEGFDRVLWLRQGKLLPQDEVKDPVASQDRHSDERPDRTPLKLLGDALLALEMPGSPQHEPCAEGPAVESLQLLWPLARAYLGTCGAGTVTLLLLLVLMQRSVQLLQFLFLATWADAVGNAQHVDHRSFAVSIVLMVALNATLLTLSEWAGSRLSLVAGLHLQSRQLRGAWEVDGVISGWLGCARSVLGSSLQQVYILLIAPQWLAVTVLLPAYVCIAFFAWIYLKASVLLALKGEESFREAQQILHESLEPDPVPVRAHQLQRSVLQHFASQMSIMTGCSLLLPACSKSWLSFRVTFCVAFLASACALQVLLCDHQIGVGTLGLVISLLFALTTDVELACESCVQGWLALGALRRAGAFAEPRKAAPEVEPMEVAEDQAVAH